MDKSFLLLFALLLPVTLLCSCAGGVEKWDYTVLEKDGPFEIRRYNPYIVAETTVDADFEEAGNTAFDRLYGYISGKNRTGPAIAMTAPVTQQPAGEKIPMTAPVTQRAAGDAYTIGFVMPSSYTMDTLPQPQNENVSLRRVPGYKAAAIRYSGTWSRKRYEAHKAKLEAFMDERSLEPAGPAVWARYDPPFQLWFLRRNEVIFPIE